jgi:hypothetical protein
VLAAIAPIQRPANTLPTAVRGVEGAVVDLRHLSMIARPGRCRSLREEASCKSAGRRPVQAPDRQRRVSCAATVSGHFLGERLEAGDEAFSLLGG